MNASDRLAPPAVDRRRLARLAARLHGSLVAASGTSPGSLDVSLHRLTARLDVVRSACARLRLARARSWASSARRLSCDLSDHLLDLQGCLTEAGAMLQRTQTATPVLTGRGILAELDAVLAGPDDGDGGGDGSGTLDGKTKHLTVTTTPIVLEGVELGRFEVSLDLGRILDGRSLASDPASFLAAAALDPNPASSDGSVTHPHVRDGSMCLGDGILPVRAALQQGRLGDALEIGVRVLQTYNGGSAYVPLDDWDGVSCDGCGRVIGSDDSASCARCSETLCVDCDTRCDACDESFCGGCIATAADGERALCPSCRGRCTACNGFDDKDGLEERDGLCVGCHESRADEDEEGDEEQDGDAGQLVVDDLGEDRSTAGFLMSIDSA